MGRVVSANYNDANGNNTPLDVQGFDYSTEHYDDWHQRAPKVPAISSETSSAVSDRGVFQNDPVAGYVRDYDTEAPGWGETAQVAWQGILDRSFIAGGFTWTGWDYRGEPTPDAWPDVNSHFGILDIAGFWKHRAHWYHSCWTPVSSEKILHLLPHWNWEHHKCEGPCRVLQQQDARKDTQFEVMVWAYSNVEEVELILPNGTSLGRQKSQPCSHTQWLSVPFIPGKLQALGFVSNQQVIATSIETTGYPAALRVSIKDSVGVDGVIVNGEDVALIQVEVIDAQGRVVPTASNLVNISVSNSLSASVLGTANGDPASHVLNTSPSRPAFNGLLMAAVRPDKVGSVTVLATSPSLQSASVTFQAIAHRASAHIQTRVVFI